MNEEWIKYGLAGPLPWLDLDPKRITPILDRCERMLAIIDQLYWLDCLLDWQPSRPECEVDAMYKHRATLVMQLDDYDPTEDGRRKVLPNGRFLDPREALGMYVPGPREVR